MNASYRLVPAALVAALLAGCASRDDEQMALSGEEARSELAGSTYQMEGRAVEFLAHGGLVDATGSGRAPVGSWYVRDERTCVYRIDGGETCYELIAVGEELHLVSNEGEMVLSDDAG